MPLVSYWTWALIHLVFVDSRSLSQTNSLFTPATVQWQFHSQLHTTFKFTATRFSLSNSLLSASTCAACALAPGVAFTGRRGAVQMALATVRTWRATSNTAHSKRCVRGRAKLGMAFVFLLLCAHLPTWPALEQVDCHQRHLNCTTPPSDLHGFAFATNTKQGSDLKELSVIRRIWRKKDGIRSPSSRTWSNAHIFDLPDYRLKFIYRRFHATTFSAFWLRSSVVSVLITLTSNPAQLGHMSVSFLK